MRKELLIVPAIVALLVAGAFVYFGPSKSELSDEAVKTKVMDALGAIPGTELPGDRSYAGARKVTTRTTLTQATSTICAIAAPMGSSTPLSLTVRLDSGYGTNTTQGPILEVFQSREESATTTAYASSTARMIGFPYRTKPGGDALIVLFDSTSSGVVVGATSTPVLVTDWWSYGPAEQLTEKAGRFDTLVVKLSNSAAGDYRGFAPTGICQSEWLVL